MDTVQIMAMLPHRQPFLLIDKVFELSENHVLATKNVVPDPENYLTFFMKMDNVKFKQKVSPGDTLIFKCSLITPIRRGICHMQGYAYANGKLCAEAELMAQISKVK